MLLTHLFANQSTIIVLLSQGSSIWDCLQTVYPKILLLITIFLPQWLHLGIKSGLFKQTQINVHQCIRVQ